MKSAAERPRVWYVVVPLVIMGYLAYPTLVVAMLLIEAWRVGFVDPRPLQNPDQFAITVGVTVCIFSILVFSLIFLFRDLLRQLSLFFRRSNP